MSKILKKSKNVIKKQKNRKGSSIRSKNFTISSQSFEFLSQKLVSQIDRELWNKKYAPAIDVLKLVGAGLFVTSALFMPNILQLAKPFLQDPYEKDSWKRFNIKYLKRTLSRLERQKLVTIEKEGEFQVVKITESGRKKVLRAAIDQLTIEKPKRWDGRWRLVSYDFPNNIGSIRDIFRNKLLSLSFYPFQESVFLHAYHCEREIEFLREYFGIGEFVRILQVVHIEHDSEFRDFFDV